MPQRLINTKNKTLEIHNPELGYEEGKVEFDGNTYQFGVNAADKKVLPDGVATRENLAVDNTASGIDVTDTNEARS